MVLEMAGKTDPGLFRAGTGRAVITPPVGFVIDGPEHGVDSVAMPGWIEHDVRVTAEVAFLVHGGNRDAEVGEAALKPP